MIKLAGGGLQNYADFHISLLICRQDSFFGKTLVIKQAIDIHRENIGVVWGLDMQKMK